MSTVSAAVLDPLLAADPAGPRITYYDDATGERIELSTVTMANWAAKTANLLRDEMGAGPGTRVAVLLPAHWQTAAVLFGIWWIGSEVLLGGGSDNSADLALCTRERLDEADEAVAGGEVAVLVMVEAFGRLIPGVLGNKLSHQDDSFSEGAGGLLEGPSYTRPETWRDLTVPPVLLSGDHAKVAQWRREQSLERTADRRPDLLPPTP